MIRKRKKDEKKEERKGEEKKDRKDIDCRHFLRGACRHGFLVRTPREGVEMCPYRHPMVYKRYMNFGTSRAGCTDDECKLVHECVC